MHLFRGLCFYWQRFVCLKPTEFRRSRGSQAHSNKTMDHSHGWSTCPTPNEPPRNWFSNRPIFAPFGPFVCNYPKKIVLNHCRDCWHLLNHIQIIRNQLHSGKARNEITFKWVSYNSIIETFVFSWCLVPLPSITSFNQKKRRGTGCSSPKSPQLWLSFLLWTLRTTGFHGFPTQRYELMLALNPCDGCPHWTPLMGSNMY